MGNALDTADNELPPPGSRWGTGAQSVLPYLTKSLQAKPAAGSGAEQRERDALAAREFRPAQPAP